MLFMVVETFEGDDMVPAYRRPRDRGRGIPEGLAFRDSWVEPSFRRCFRLLRCTDLRAIQAWVLHWRGTGARFEIVPVLPGTEVRAVVAPLLDAEVAAQPSGAVAS